MEERLGPEEDFGEEELCFDELGEVGDREFKARGLMAIVQALSETLEEKEKKDGRCSTSVAEGFALALFAFLIVDLYNLAAERTLKGGEVLKERLEREINRFGETGSEMGLEPEQIENLTSVAQKIAGYL